MPQLFMLFGASFKQSVAMELIEKQKNEKKTAKIW